MTTTLNYLSAPTLSWKNFSRAAALFTLAAATPLATDLAHPLINTLPDVGVRFWYLPPHLLANFLTLFGIVVIARAMLARATPQYKFILLLAILLLLTQLANDIAIGLAIPGEPYPLAAAQFIYIASFLILILRLSLLIIAPIALRRFGQRTHRPLWSLLTVAACLPSILYSTYVILWLAPYVFNDIAWSRLATDPYGAIFYLQLGLIYEQHRILFELTLAALWASLSIDAFIRARRKNISS